MEVFGSNGIIAGGIETALGTNRLGVTSEGGGTEKFGSAGGEHPIDFSARSWRSEIVVMVAVAVQRARCEPPKAWG